MKHARYYSPEILALLDCTIPAGYRKNWLVRVLSMLKYGNGIQPLYYSLILQGFGISVEQFLETKLTLKYNKHPFGDGPWPCLDITGNHYKQLTIDKYNIGRNIHDYSIATFRCSCGFHYTRKAKDNNLEGLYKFNRITARSVSWENTLKELWLDSSITIKEIATRFEIDSNTITRHAKKLGLGSRSNQLNNKKQDNFNSSMNTNLSSTQKMIQEKLERYKREWLALRAKYPDANRSFFQINFRRIKSWLYKNDPKWLEANQPPTCQYIGIDWQSRDLKFADNVRKAAQIIKQSLSKPQKVTVKEICRTLNYEANYFYKASLSKMPLTFQALKEVIDTSEDFILRRIKWAKAIVLSKGIAPRFHQFLKIACLTPSRNQLKPHIQEIIDNFLQDINAEKLDGTIK